MERVASLPPDTMSRSNCYYVFNTLFNTPEKYSRIFCILSLRHNIFIMVINKLTKLLKVTKLTKKLINWSQSVTSTWKKLFQWQMGNSISFWELHQFENILSKKQHSLSNRAWNLDQTEFFMLCDILFVDFGCIPNNSCNKRNHNT